MQMQYHSTSKPRLNIVRDGGYACQRRKNGKERENGTPKDEDEEISFILKESSITAGTTP
jgi:hypothetical protein